MTRYILALCLFTFLCRLDLQAQIGIYTDTPDASSVLDVTSGNKGVLFPRMTTVQKNAIALPAHSLLVYDTDLECVSQNLGSTTAPKWTCLRSLDADFFYMPSIIIPVRNASNALLVGTQTLDLYTIYQTQFGTPGGKNPTAPTSIPSFNSADLYYYVTYCDPSITISGITDAGIMSYTVNNGPNYDSYANIIFVIK